MAPKNRRGEAMMDAVSLMNDAVKGMRYAAKTCNIEDMAMHANAFGFYEGMLTDMMFESGSTIDQFPNLERQVNAAKTEFVRAKEISKRGCKCNASDEMREISDAVEDEHLTRIAMIRKGRHKFDNSGEDRYELDRMLRGIVYHY